MIIYIAFGAALSFFVILIMATLIKGNTKTKKQIQIEYQRAWNEVDKVGELCELYFRMVLKHGPDSSEAESFRFGVENEQLNGQTDAIKAFNTVARRFDKAWDFVHNKD